MAIETLAIEKHILACEAATIGNSLRYKNPEVILNGLKKRKDDILGIDIVQEKVSQKSKDQAQKKKEYEREQLKKKNG